MPDRPAVPAPPAEPLRWFWCPWCMFVIWAFRSEVPWHRVRKCSFCADRAGAGS